MKHYKGLDSLRAFAVLVVVIAHWWLPIEINDSNKNIVFWIKALVPNGSFGVDLFFVLSGFLITSILLYAVETEGVSKLKIIKNFIIRRALRIFPIYYLAIFVLISIDYPFIQENLSWFLLYVSNMLVFETKSFNAFSHTWSLAVEEQFYLVWPWFLVFVREKYLKYVFLGAIFLGVFTAVYVMKIQHDWTGYVLMPTYMQAFGLGGLYAYLNKTGKKRLFLKFIYFAFPLSLFIHFYWAFSSTGGGNYDYLHLTINSIISIWLIHKTIYNKSKIIDKLILRNWVLNKIGQISYGIYLYHFAIEFVYIKLIKLFITQDLNTQAFLIDWKNSYFIRLALLLVISLISFHFIEKPILKLKDKFAY